MAIRSRPPTGIVPWPFLLLDGDEKAGKSLCAAAFTSNPRVGPAYWFDLGEGSADEYAVLPGARYEVIEHDGTFRDILGQLTEVHAEARRAAAAKEPPVVVVFDTLTAEWQMLVEWANSRAARTESNRKKLAADPDVEIDVTSNFWNDANARHKRIIELLQTFPGIVIGIARGKEVAVMDSRGQPTKDTTWKPDGQKNLAFDCTMWIRLRRDSRRAEIMGARSLKLTFPKKGPLPVPDEGYRRVGKYDVLDLGYVVFEMLGCDPHQAHVRDVRRLAGDTAQRYVEQVGAILDVEELKALWETAKADRQLDPEHRAVVSKTVADRLEVLRNNPAPPADEPQLIPPDEPVVDPDCRDGKHSSCVGGPCVCPCHTGDLPEQGPSPAAETIEGKTYPIVDGREPPQEPRSGTEAPSAAPRPAPPPESPGARAERVRRAAQERARKERAGAR